MHVNKQLLDEVFVISGIIKVEVSVISRSRRLRLITLTETLIIPDITKTESNNCFITQAVRPGFSFRLSFFFRVQSQIAVWPLERMRHLCSVRHGSFTEVVVA